MAQMVVLNAKGGLVRKLILAGTGPTAGEGVVGSRDQDFVKANAGRAVPDVENLLNLFFKESEESRKKGREWWGRIHERTKETSGEERAGYVSEGFADGGAGSEYFLQLPFSRYF